MTWIKTVRMEEDEGVKKAIEDERKLYPAEYTTPVPTVFAEWIKASSARTRCFRMCCFMRSARLGLCCLRNCRWCGVSMK